MARRFWRGDAVGKRVRFNDDWLTIVGIVGNVKHASLDDSTRVTVYLPVRQQPTRYLMVIARASVDATALTPLVRQAIASLDPSVPVTRVDAMPALVERSFARERFRSALIGLFAAIAAVLAAVGMYGVTARAVARQRREIGIRMAIGSSRGRVIALFLRRAGVPVSLGIAGGMLAAVLAARFLAPYLYATNPTDPMLFAASAALLVAAALVAAWLPAHRAARTSPASVLRDS